MVQAVEEYRGKAEYSEVDKCGSNRPWKEV